MSFDRLQVTGTETRVRGPSTYENSAITSATSNVAIGGLAVSESGKTVSRPYPPVGTVAISVGASAFTFTNDMLASRVVRVTADGQAATGAIMPTPAASGQEVILINTGRHNITFNATVATSNVAGDGTMVANVRSYSSQGFLSDGTRWYQHGRLG